MIDRTKPYYAYEIVHKWYDSLLVITQLLENIDSVFIEMVDKGMMSVKEAILYIKKTYLRTRWSWFGK